MQVLWIALTLLPCGTTFIGNSTRCSFCSTKVEQALGCDDMGLTGAEREAVVQTQPMCTLFNPSCNKWETKVKEFKACSDCQKED
jgi:hypothetical protein